MLIQAFSWLLVGASSVAAVVCGRGGVTWLAVVAEIKTSSQRKLTRTKVLNGGKERRRSHGADLGRGCLHRFANRFMLTLSVALEVR